jgi:ribosomal-protein-alanine N-acetyltransferase
MGAGTVAAGLETPRTSLRPISVGDADLVYATLQDPRVTRYLDQPPPSLEAARAMIEVMAAPETGRWWVVRARDGRALGFAGLNRLYTPGVGIVLDPAAWGHGLATEVLGAVVRYALEAMRLSRVEAQVHEDNAAARAVVERLGFTVRGLTHRFYPAEGRVRLTSVWGKSGENPAGAAGPQADPVTKAEVCKQLVLLPVQDIRATLSFYVGSLGFRLDFVQGDPPQYAAVSLGCWSSDVGRIHFFASPDAAVAGARPTVYLCLGDDLSSVYQRARENGAAVTREPLEIQAGTREFVLTDPDGYRVAFRDVL